MAVIQLPALPSVRSLDFSMLETIQNTLRRYVSSSTRNDSETYIETYAKHTAHCALQSVVWGTDSRIPEQIEQLTLLIAQRAAYPIAVHTLIDLSVVYAQSYPAQLQLLFQAQYSLYPSQLTESIAKDVLPVFTTLLSSTSDTYKALASKRKISESIVSFLAACSSIRPLIRPFAHSEHFIRALASLYHPQLTLIAESYGGSRALLAPSTNDPDDWSRIWIQTKIALIDSFHIVFTALSDDLAS
jgi:activating signal cointegrator complex subunit 2